MDLVYREIMYTAPDYCTLPEVAQLKRLQTELKGERSILPQVFALFDPSVTEYYLCQYYKATKNPRYEAQAVTYLETHGWQEDRTQRVLYGHIRYYLPDDFISPMAWCEKIEARDDLACDLYTTAAHYRGMIGDYDLAEALLQRAHAYDAEGRKWLYQGQDSVPKHFQEREAELQRWRNKKAYWPTSEERRRALAVFYDERGITYPRIESKPKKIAESNFEPISEYLGKAPAQYCAFWCAAGFSVTSAKCVYQIAAVRVDKGEVTDQFQNYIRPWDGDAARKAAAKDGGISAEVLAHAEDVDLVMKRFFAFVGGSVLVSTDALGEQAKLISRAARYSGMAKISNQFLDLLDLAEDTLEGLELSANSRTALLRRCHIEEGSDALGKALANHQLFQKLMSREK